MEPFFVAAVLVVTLKITSADESSCEVRPLFNTKEESADFLAKPSWIGDGDLLYEEESVFVRRRHCPVRVRMDEEATKAPSLGNGSHNKEANTAKKNNSHRKLKGSKRKRKKEKRKRFRKKKKKNAPQGKKKR